MKNYPNFPPKFLSFITLTIIFLLVLSCKKETREIEQPPKVIDSLNIEIPEKEVPRLVITYRQDSLKTTQEVDSLYNTYSKEEQRLIFALNRIEQVRVGVGTKLIIPDTLITDYMAYAPLPQELSILDSVPKTVLISQRIQAFGLYENGSLIKWGPISSGKLSTPTPNGLHYGNYKAKRKISTVNSDWILPYYFNFMNFEGVGVHQYLLPGFPASHACVRLDMDDAKYIYDWAKQWELDPTGNEVVKHGTPFMVFGDYSFEEQPPWFNLPADPVVNDLNESELATIEKYVSEYLKDHRNFPDEDEIEVLEDILVFR